MKQKLISITMSTIIIALICAGMSGCGNVNFLKRSTPLIAEPLDPEDPEAKPEGEVPLNGLFNASLGSVVTLNMLKSIQPDSTGLNPQNDYDGDGLENSKEIFTNPYVADYPRLVTRIAPPITMEIETNTTIEEKNHTETLEEDDMKDTISNSMEDKQYTSLAKKTTPYVTKESYEESASKANGYGYENSNSHSEAESNASSMEVSAKVAWGGNQGHAGEVSGSYGQSQSSSNEFSDSKSMKENSNVEDSFKKATMSEKTVFDNIDYIDNKDSHGLEFKSETVQNISKNFRNKKDKLTIRNVGNEAGVVTAGLFIRNTSINMPVKVSNIRCTLSFRTPSGECLPIETFRLRNEDYSMLEDTIPGGEELGPFTIKVTKLKTEKVQNALAKGYIPQIHVVSYTMERVQDSNYNPGVDNLKMVEEAAKGRTAVMNIAGSGIREMYRVCAFDVVSNGGSPALSPGISLKKALFNVFADRIGDGESFEKDIDGQPLTVPDNNLRWKPGAANKKEYVLSSNKKGNQWRQFETYVKSYTDEFNRIHYIETIKRIGNLKKYNPFSVMDNTSYDPNELLTNNEFYKMKYWIILHNGKYFEGDINDPIWAGERYEIICVDIRDFNNHYAYNSFYYSPIQTNEPLFFDTRWNKLNNEVTDERPYPRARYLGRIVRSDVVNLDINLLESRFLFDGNLDDAGLNGMTEYLGDYRWFAKYFNYNLSDGSEDEVGIPGEFSHSLIGGINNIKVSITNSKNAREYIISFPGSSLKSVKISQKELAENNGVVTICRETQGINGPVGFINGNRIYDVHVTAYGKSFGWDVYKESIFNNTSESEVSVKNPESGALPKVFTFKASSTTNQLNVCISDAADTEYYLIKYKGPFNLGTSPSNSGTTVLAHEGLNIIHIPTPSGSSTSSEGGIYFVEVVSANKNNMSTNGKLSWDEQFVNIKNNTEYKVSGQYVEINYDIYAKQKELMAAKSSDLFDLRVLDNLEVNFNDGSGWYKLILTNSDPYAGRRIDCRKSSYMDYAGQKFHISFKLPRGSGDAFGNFYNVFTGGKDEVDLYIRTIAREEYRDRFWLKPNAKFEDENGEQADSFIQTPQIPQLKSFVDYWLMYTDSSSSTFSADATDIKTSVTQINNFPDKYIDNYFFSPLSYRGYMLRASITDILKEDEELCPAPIFDIAAKENSIDITIHNPAGVDFWEIYYKIGESYVPKDDPKQDFKGEEWGRDRCYTDKCTISKLYKNTPYIVVVKALNDFMESEPIAKGPIMPYSNEKPVRPQYITAYYDNVLQGIHLDDIYVDDEYQYKIQYQTCDKDPSEDAAWIDFMDSKTGGYLKADIKPSSKFEQNEMNGGNYIPSLFEQQAFLKCDLTKGLSKWKGYRVRVCAVTGSDKLGDWWVSEVIEPLKKVPTFALGDDKRSIIVNNIYSSDYELMYDIQYKMEGESYWHDFTKAFQGGFITDSCKVYNSADNKPFDVLASYRVRVILKPGSQYSGQIIMSDIIEMKKLDWSTVATSAEWYSPSQITRYVTHTRSYDKHWACRRGICKYWYKHEDYQAEEGYYYFNKLRINIDAVKIDEKGYYEIWGPIEIEGKNTLNNNTSTNGETVKFSYTVKGQIPATSRSIDINLGNILQGIEGVRYNCLGYIDKDNINHCQLGDVKMKFKLKYFSSNGNYTISDEQVITAGNPYTGL